MPKHDPNDIEQQVIDAIRSLKYGAVEVLIHDSRVVQVEKRKKPGLILLATNPLQLKVIV